MCDAAGMDVWVGDSIVAKPRLEPLTTLAYLAAMTQRARLGTAVCYRPCASRRCWRMPSQTLTRFLTGAWYWASE